MRVVRQWLDAGKGARVTDPGWSDMSNCGQNDTRELALVTVLPAQPPTPRLTRIKLGTIREIRAELSRVYREARSGKIDTSTATRLAYLLDLMARMVERGELETRIETLEAKAGK